MSSKSAKTSEVSKTSRVSHSWSLAARLTVWYALSSFALVLAATGYLYWALVRNLDREDDHFLADQALPLVNLVREKSADQKMIRRQIELAWTARPDPNVYFRVLDARFRIVADTPGMGLVIPRPNFTEAQPLDRDTVQGQNYLTADERPFRILALQTDSTPPFIIQVAMDRSHAEDLLADYRRNLGLVLGIALLACSLGGYYIARRGIRPVKNIAEAAGRIGALTLNERIVRANLPTELMSLARTFNAMLDRLESSFAQVAQFASEIAHELRTPINNLRGEAEVALRIARTPAEYQDILASALEEYDRLSRLIDSLLFLARSENPAQQIQREPIDLGQELERLREFYEGSATEGGVTLRIACQEKMIVELDRTLFQRAVGNLVSNSLRYTSAGGSITLSARTENGCWQVDVADTGAGIDPVHLPRLFDRFYRADNASSPQENHIGLGLTIVKKIAELHGGSVAVASEVGTGTRVTLSFPGPPNHDPSLITKL